MSSTVISYAGTEPAVAIVGSDELGIAEALASSLLADAAGSADILIYGSKSFRASEAEAVRALVREYPLTPVLVVSSIDDPARVKYALEAGASGYIAASELHRALPAAIAVLAAGQMCLPFSYRKQAGRPTFTTREKQILALVVMGLSNGEIGRKLYLAESTVKSHLSSAFSKLGVRSRNEATAKILDPSSNLGQGILRISEGLPETHRITIS